MSHVRPGQFCDSGGQQGVQQVRCRNLAGGRGRDSMLAVQSRRQLHGGGERGAGEKELERGSYLIIATTRPLTTHLPSPTY